MAKANTSPVSGTRDLLPLDVLRRRYVVDIVESVYQRYGFEPLETPALERLDTLLGKYGEEGDQLIFRVLKRGEKLKRALSEDPVPDALADAGLRYDLTVPLARVAAQYQARLPRYLKRYQIQPVYRADRPARGRFREFFQCDLDIVGSSSPLVEAEILNAAAEVFEQLGFSDSDFQIRLNHRGILAALMESVSIETDKEQAALIALDKLDKIGLEGVVEELHQRGISSSAARALLKAIKQIPEKNYAALDWLAQRLAKTAQGRPSCLQLRQIVDYCRQGSAFSYLRVDPFLARGLTYYTGPIFEVAFEGFGGSAGGGGRYDDLIGMFLGRQVPACGFSLGLERILIILEEKDMFPTRLSGQPEVLMTQFSEATAEASLKLARRLRLGGIRVDLYPDLDRYGRQFKYADQRQIRYALLLSPQELKAGTVAVKDLESGDQVDLAEGDLEAFLRERLEET